MHDSGLDPGDKAHATISGQNNLEGSFFKEQCRTFVAGLRVCNSKARTFV